MKSMLELMAQVNAEMRASPFCRTVTGGVSADFSVGDGHGLIIRHMWVQTWTGLKEAAKVLGRTETQIRRHVSGEQPSAKLARAMELHGITVIEVDKGVAV